MRLGWLLYVFRCLMKGRNQWDSGVLSDTVGSSTLTKSTPDSLHPTPLGSAVSTPQFSGPARHHLDLCSEPCPSACLSSSHSLPPSLPPSSLRSSQFLTDTSCSLCSPLTISFSSLISKSASPIHLVNQLLSPFCTHCPISWLTLPVLGPQTPTAPLLDFLLSLSGHLLPSAFQSTFSHLLIALAGGQGINALRCPDLQHMQIAGFYSKDSKRCLLDRQSIMPFTELLLSVQSMQVLSNEISHNFFQMLRVIPFPLLRFSKMATVWAKKFQKIQPQADIQCGKFKSKYKRVISSWKQGLIMRSVRQHQYWKVLPAWPIIQALLKTSPRLTIAISSYRLMPFATAEL